MSEETRPASSPAAGAARVTVAVTVAQIVSFLAASSGAVPADIKPQTDFLITTAVTAGLALLGKILRQKFPELPTPV